MKTVKLSVSSVILISVLSGCSQQQLGGSSQIGSQQLVDGSQVTSNKKSQSSDDFYESKAHRKERLGLTSQQQVESSVVPVAKPAKSVIKPKTPKAKVVVRKKPRATHSVSTMGLPPAKPGQCFAKVKVPAKYVTKTKRILIQKASTRRVLVRATQYRWVNKKVLVRKATSKARVIPAQYKTVTQRKMIKPSYVTWKKGHGAITRIDNMTGEIMCKVRIPAKYQTVTKRVLVRKAQTVRTFVAAVYKTVKQKQRVSGAIYKTVHKPARYKTQNYRVKVGNARYIWKGVLCKTNAPKHYRNNHRKINRSKRKASTQQYQNYNFAGKSKVENNYRSEYIQSNTNYQHYIAPVNTDTGYYEIRENTDKASVKKPKIEGISLKKELKNRKLTKAERKRRIVYKIQNSLKKEGFNPGVIDGKIGPRTTAALKAFQSSKGLSIGVLNTETFTALGMVNRSQDIQLASVE